MTDTISILDIIHKDLQTKQTENIFFKKHLRGVSSIKVDEHIHRLYNIVANEIDCTLCGNCCKKLEPGIETDEIDRLAQFKGIEPIDFKRLYVAYDGEAQYLKTKPCMFLSGCKCTIYDSRPNACAGYPHLDQPNMKYKRSLWENYSICPIVYQVIELLKLELGFSYGK